MDLSDQRFIKAKFSDERGSRAVTCRALIDTGADVTCINEYIATELQLDNYEYVEVMSAADGRIMVKQCSINIQIDEETFRGHSVLVLPSLSEPLIGWDVLSKGSVLSSVVNRVFSEVIHLLGSLGSFKRNIVLVLGQDTTEIHRLRAIQNRLKELGYTGIIVKDIADIEIQSIEEKVNMLASLCRFVVCENSVASGHIDELKICAQNRFVTAILQQEGLGATWMQADYSLDYSFIRSFHYPTLESIKAFVDAAVEWAEAKLEERRNFLNGLYHWR